MIRTAQPAIDNKVHASVEEYAEYRRKNRNPGAQSIVERYVQRERTRHHKKSLLGMKSSVDNKVSGVGCNPALTLL